MRVCLQCACLPSDKTRMGTVSPGAQPAVGSTKCPSRLSQASSRQLQGCCSCRRGPEADRPVRRGLTRPRAIETEQRESEPQPPESKPHDPHRPCPGGGQGLRAQAPLCGRQQPSVLSCPELPTSWKHLQLVSGPRWEDRSQNLGLRSSTAHEFSPPRVATPRSPNLRHSCAPRLLS